MIATRTKLLAALALVAALAVSFWRAGWPAITAKDQEQGRLSQAAPVPRGNSELRQTFIAAHNGLSSLDLLAVVYPEAPPDAALILRLLDSDNTLLASAVFRGHAHNAPLRLSFTPLPDSAGKTYTLVVAGDERNNTTVWAYSLDSYSAGTLTQDGQPLPGDLRFTTHYTFLWPDLLREAARRLGQLALLIVPLWAILFAPGLLFIDLLGLAALWPMRWARWGMALGFSLCLLMLAWLWVSTVGLRWSAVGFAVVYVLVGLAVVARSLWNLRRGFQLADLPHDLCVFLILLLSLSARLLAVRDLALPAWVDSPHNYTIARLFVELGRIPADYLPLLPVGGFNHHFGFHALAATVHWLTGRSLVETFLTLGQLLNGLAPLAAYTLTVTLTRRPRAGLFAAFFVGFVSLFPAYYVSWGRYTQLAGVIVLAPVLTLAAQFVAPNHFAAGDGHAQWKPALGLGILAAGLLTIHYRVFLAFVIFAVVAVAAGERGGWKRMSLTGLLGLLLAAPWVWHLTFGEVARVAGLPGGFEASVGYNIFPVEYFDRPLEKGWLILAGLALMWGFLRRERSVWLVGGWAVVTSALVNFGPGTWLVNNNAWAIMLFLPGAFVLGWAGDYALNLALVSLVETAATFRQVVGLGVVAALAGLLAYAGAQGLSAQISILNPDTVLADAADADALAWVDQHLPAEAVFLVNSWTWQKWRAGAVWAGSDGGTWLWPLLNRRTTAPPLDYFYQPDWAKTVNAFNEQAMQIQDAGAPETLNLLRSAGVTHVFIGARGGPLKPEMFVGNAHYHLLYTNGADWVFELIP